MVLKFLGLDSSNRPVYQDRAGNLYVDVNPRKDYAPKIFTKYRNSFDGEPCDPVRKEVTLVPRRYTWD